MKVFLSYSWDNESHQKWVVNLANKLRENGVEANVDIFYFQKETTNINKMMIKNISISDYIILVLTEGYKKKVDDWKGGVGFENELLLPILKTEIERDKLIFIMRHNGDYSEVFPFHFKDYYAIDFSNDRKFDIKFKELLHRIYKKPLYAEEEIGRKPNLASLSLDIKQSHSATLAIHKSFTKLDFNSNVDKVIRVNDVKQFIKSIGSNRIIHLSQGIYNISKATGVKNKHIKWVKEFDGKAPLIKGIENLTITADVGTQILINPRYVYVFSFLSCNNISFQNVTIGHTQGGYCIGGVLSFQNSADILIEETVLFGCGTIGLELTNTTNLQFISSTIKECTYSLMYINGSDNILFANSVFKDTGEFDLIDINNSTKIYFSECTILNNRTVKFMPYLFKIDEYSRDIIVERSIIKYNEIDEFVNNNKQIKLIDCEINRNNFAT